MGVLYQQTLSLRRSLQVMVMCWEFGPCFQQLGNPASLVRYPSAEKTMTCHVDNGEQSIMISCYLIIVGI